MRRRLILLVTGVLAAAGIVTLAPAAEANGFCGPEEGCDPCPFTVVLDGKNTRVEWYQC